MCKPHFCQNYGHFQYNISWLCFDLSWCMYWKWPQFWKKWGFRNRVLKMNGLYVCFMFWSVHIFVHCRRVKHFAKNSAYLEVCFYRENRQTKSTAALKLRLRSLLHAVWFYKQQTLFKRVKYVADYLLYLWGILGQWDILLLNFTCIGFTNFL